VVAESEAVIPAGDGSGGRIRTYDQRINSPLRYRCATPEYPKLGRAAPLASARPGVVAYITGSPGCKAR
jgi:hypothetical protein